MAYKPEYTCKHFIIEELVPPTVYKKYGIHAWKFFDVGLLKAIDRLRDDMGSIKINDWKWGGSYSQSGLRDFDFDKSYSLHKMGKAFDLKFKDYTADEARVIILSNPKRYPEITRMELKTATWVHVDSANCDTEEGIYTFDPY